MWGVSGRPSRTGRATPTGHCSARPLGFATTDLSFASVLPFATRRTRSGTTFGQVWKRDFVIAARGDDAGMLLQQQTVDIWMRIRVGRLPTLGRRVVGGWSRGRHRGSGVSLWMGR